MITTGKQLAEAALNAASNYRTLYVAGCFGAPMTEANKKRYTQNHSYNKTADRTRLINAAAADTFGFDCVCLIKGLLWGWRGDISMEYGGARYASNGVPDIGEDAMIAMCSGVSTDFSKIETGEAVWLPGHIGIYSRGRAGGGVYAELEEQGAGHGGGQYRCKGWVQYPDLDKARKTALGGLYLRADQYEGG